DEGQRADLAAAITARPARIARDDERVAAAREIAGVWRLFGDAPPTGQTDAVWVQQAPEPLPVRSPPQVCSRIDRARRRVFEAAVPQVRHQSAKDASNRSH